MYFKSEAVWQKELIKELAKKYGIDIRVVRQMVYYPFLFHKHRMADDKDGRPLRHRQLGVWLLKKRYERQFEEFGVKKSYEGFRHTGG